MRKTKRALSSNLNSKNNIKKEILNQSLDKNCLLNIKAQVINSKLIHANGYNADYVEYWIEIITDYKKWIIKKRYSQFYELNQKIIQKIPDINKLFPPKRFFKNSEDTIEERKTSFNKYLKFLFLKNNIFSFNEVLDFIQIEKKIVELYIKKHTMVKQDQDNLIFQSLKRSFNRMNLLEKMEKSKSVGENLNINGIDSISTKISSKEDLNHGKNINNNNINENIFESSDTFYEIEELNPNYYSTLLEYENNKNIQQRQKDNKENDYISYYKKEGGTVVIEEFLKNLSQDIDNKIDILKTFEEFLKQKQKWPKFSISDIIKLYVGNINNTTISIDKKLNLGLNKINKSNNNSKKLTDNKEIERKLTSKNKKIIDTDKDDKTSDDDDDFVLKGLFYYIGDFSNNILLSFSCLELLVKLLNNEFNPDVDIYLRIFKTRKISDYQSMRLEEIMKKNIGGVKSTKNALKLLTILMEEKNKEVIKKTLIKDENILKQLSLYNNHLYD